jgi:catechol 2,3-dioxygenase-like lactoylglutathione lyase family enzyme
MAASPLQLHLVTLGVADVERAAEFYEELGLKRHMKKAEGVAFFDGGGVVISLYGRDALERDAGLTGSKAGFGGASLAFNLGSEKAVDDALAAAKSAGAKILKDGHRVFWGGYIGYFSDLDGHVWEVAHNPQFPFDECGRLVLPD